MPHSILVINPNSSESVTSGLRDTLSPPPDTTLTFYTAPSHAPPSINDLTTANLTATACFEDILAKGLVELYDGFLVCCFSDHPLIHMLRETTPKPTIGILQSAIVHALLIGDRFSVVSTGSGYRYNRHAEIRACLGGDSARFAGIVMTGLGVVELREGERAHVESAMKDASAKAAASGADVLLLGCAGMAGMEVLVQQGVAEAGLKSVRIVDGAKAGVQFLASLIRLSE
ncbi:hypothetical protein HETIRDRAFT_49067 [Heterobasidion irregulare TC 32-1]|uniref:Asp/Glu/hydantoin racemase n=1 Tax=Heterobasidion irregulare (strain TC 32-1) TaxID=747525 RepID=W4K1U4_HETIT|nr:uncharacterized protein HETIRDRAFT_49067 [Heterobasidion irregulare TC 32-1]ETW79773.1 hypothetical protein HETIRDRAFT_49067 [Heterobasidion irregulare TC 32-1]